MVAAPTAPRSRKPSVARTKKIAKSEARKAIDKLNPTGHEVSLSPATWGQLQDIAAGDARSLHLGQTIDFGNNQGDRLTNKIMYKGLRYTLRMVCTSNAIDAKLCARVLVLYQPNSTGVPTATGGKLWQSDTDSLTPVDFTPNDINNLVRKVNRNRYKVLYDKKHWFAPSSWYTAGIAGAGHRVATGYVKINKLLRYNTDYLSGDGNVLPNIHLVFFIQTQAGITITSASGLLKYGVRYDEYFKKQ